MNDQIEKTDSQGTATEVRTFTEADLTSFGEYLLSRQRTNRVASHYDDGDEIDLEERLRTVYDADFRNWEETMIGAPANSNS